MSPKRPVLIKGGYIVSQDKAIGDIAAGDVLIQDQRIVDVGVNLEVTDAEVIDARGMIVSPGFVDTHRHVWQSLLRTVASDWTLFNYTTSIRLGYSSCYTESDAFLGNYSGAIEALNAGVTTVVDHSHIMNSPEHANQALRGLQESGIRAVFCYGLFPNPKQHPFRFDDFDPGWRAADARRIRETHLASDDGPIYMGLAPSEVEKAPFEKACAEIALGRDLQAQVISCHVAMSGYSTAFGRSFTTKLGQEGLLGPDILLVHGNSLNGYELNMVVDAGAGISATPEVEVQMGMGRPVLAAAMARGAKVGLGVDIVSNIPGDMFHPMRASLEELRGASNDVLVARDEVPRRLEVRSRDVLELATIGGARAIGLDSQIGSLTPGKRADVICVSRESLNMMGATDPAAALVFYATANDVDTVFVNGRMLKRARQLVDCDVQSLTSSVRDARSKIDERFSSLSVSDFEGYYKGKYNFGN